MKLPRTVGSRATILVCVLAICTGVLWVVTWALFRDEPAFLAAAGVSYTLGLRHALDADHISAIDNVTRKLMAENKYSTTVGFFFSVGHSTLVIAGCIVLYLTERAIQDRAPTMMTILTIVSSIFASGFLITIGLMNLWQLISVHRELQRLKKEKVYRLADHPQGFHAGGGMVKCCGKGLFRLVDKSWKMTLVGLVFGLGFDTTASVTAIISTAVSKMHVGYRMEFKDALILSLLFTVGMVTLDSLDGIMMLGTYKWSDKKVVRRLFFNYVIMLISVIAALAIGTIILLRLIVQVSECNSNWFCQAIEFLDSQFQYIGIGLTLVIVTVWVGGVCFYRHSHWATLEDEVIVINDNDANLENELLSTSPSLHDDEDSSGKDDNIVVVVASGEHQGGGGVVALRIADREAASKEIPQESRGKVLNNSSNGLTNGMQNQRGNEHGNEHGNELNKGLSDGLGGDTRRLLELVCEGDCTKSVEKADEGSANPVVVQ